MALIQPKETKRQQKPPTTVSHAFRPPSGNCDGSMPGGGPAAGAGALSSAAGAASRAEPRDGSPSLETTSERSEAEPDSGPGSPAAGAFFSGSSTAMAGETGRCTARQEFDGPFSLCYGGVPLGFYTSNVEGQGSTAGRAASASAQTESLRETAAVDDETTHAHGGIARRDACADGAASAGAGAGSSKRPRARGTRR